ncbi:MAG: NAD(P)-binding protein [Candidatus Thermoplasmatota archaeon]|nr:NAD(P)-binding protein [Candidatus Thermoplasmatota archaeon]
MKPKVAVVGGGWAGCAAALTVAEAGVAVTLYEASRTLGGRARAVELEGEALDNGQHILLGAYEETLGLIDRVHPGAAQNGLWRLPLTIEQPPDFRLACPRLPAPLHLAVGLLGARGLGWGEKLAAARWAQRPGLVMAAIYRTLLEEIRRSDFPVLRARVALTPLRKLWIAGSTWLFP